MLVRRLAVAVALAVSSSGSVVAEEPTLLLPAESVVNWTAPPYWSPPEAVAREKSTDVGALGTMAIEAVPTGPLPFFGITPCRLVDTRPPNGFTGAYGPPILAANATRDFDLNSVPHCPGVPVSAQAYSLNVTVTETTGPGDVRLWPTGSPPLVPVSTQNWAAANVTIANAAVVPAGTNGSITVLVAGSATHLIIDINGYYAPQTVVNSVNGLSGAVTLSPGSNVSIQTVGGPLFISAPNLWSLSGNSTSPGNFLGTTNLQPLEFRVNGQRAFRIEPAWNIVAGANVNAITAGVVGGTIGGGGNTDFPNIVSDNFGTVSGGTNNRAGDGAGTTADAFGATIAGGLHNIASRSRSVVSGGISNHATGTDSTISGGNTNTASGQGAIVPGGSANTAQGDFSFAAGRGANAVHQGAFIWADSTGAAVASTNTNQFVVRAGGGIWFGTNSSVSIPAGRFINTSTGAHLTTTGVWTNNSDRAAKENLQPVDGNDLLTRLVSLPVLTWSYKSDKGSIRHIGPMAQDFAAAFRVGNDDRSIGTVDAEGVALAAIQALYEMVKEKEGEIEALKVRLSKLETRVD
jgi:hypothetical protein